MTRLVVTMNRRESSSNDVSSLILVVDLESRRILVQARGIEAPYRYYDNNPRGGMRGMRGISAFNGELAIAGYSAVFFFDCHWNLIRVITHPSVAGIHEIEYGDHGVWVTSTANDTLVRFDLAGNLVEHYYLRAEQKIITPLGYRIKTSLHADDIVRGKIDFRIRSFFVSDIHDRLHVNSVTISPSGRIFVSLGLIAGNFFNLMIDVKILMKRLNLWNPFLAINHIVRRILGVEKQMLSELVVRPEQGESAIISVDQSGDWEVHYRFFTMHNPSHSIRILDDGTCLYLDTSHGKLLHFDLDGNTLSANKISEKFMRGLLVLSDNQLVIGADNTLLFYDLQTLKIVYELELSSDPLTTVFDIKVLPADFELPPSSLEEKIGKVAGFDGQNVIWENASNANPYPHP